MKRESTWAIYFLILLLTSIFFFNFVYPFDRQFLSRFAFLSPSYFAPKKSPFIGTCDYSRGHWVWDETYTHRLYDENCPFLDPGFRCHQNGRKNETFRKWRWQPDDCDIPRYVIYVGILSYTLSATCCIACIHAGLCMCYHSLSVFQRLFFVCVFECFFHPLPHSSINIFHNATLDQLIPTIVAERKVLLMGYGDEAQIQCECGARGKSQWTHCFCG